MSEAGKANERIEWLGGGLTKIGFDINAVNGGGSDGLRSRHFGLGL